jgi:hypothetical protein
MSCHWRSFALISIPQLTPCSWYQNEQKKLVLALNFLFIIHRRRLEMEARNYHHAFSVSSWFVVSWINITTYWRDYENRFMVFPTKSCLLVDVLLIKITSALFDNLFHIFITNSIMLSACLFAPLWCVYSR